MSLFFLNLLYFFPSSILCFLLFSLLVIFLPVRSSLSWDDDSFPFSYFLPPLLPHQPGMFFPPKTTNKQNNRVEVLTLLTSTLGLCVVCFFSPLSLSSTHTLTQSDTGQVGGVYHSLMSLVDSVMSVVDSWDCRKKDDECCHQCSCLVCRNPQLC